MYYFDTFTSKNYFEKQLQSHFQTCVKTLEKKKGNKQWNE